MYEEFVVYLLNDEGKAKAKGISDAFCELMETIRAICPEGRQLSIAQTKLEEACFFAKKAMASDASNREH